MEKSGRPSSGYAKGEEQKNVPPEKCRKVLSVRLCFSIGSRKHTTFGAYHHWPLFFPVLLFRGLWATWPDATSYKWDYNHQQPSAIARADSQAISGQNVLIFRLGTAEIQNVLNFRL